MSFYPPSSTDPGMLDTHKIAKAWEKALAKHFGLTFQQDHAGEFGDAGGIYLTLRASLPEVGDCHITMKVQAIKPGMV